MEEKQTEFVTSRIFYTNLDILKLICSLLVIVIHTNPFVDYPVAHFYTANVVLRIAVPLFFGMTGFFLFGQMSYENGKLADCVQNRSRMLRYLKKTVRLYLFWAVVYLLLLIPEWYTIGWWGWTAVKDALHAFLIKGMFGHLWYLMALIWSVPILYMFLRVFTLRKLRWIAAVLWIVQCLFTTYSWAWSGPTELYNLLFGYFPVVFNATLCALPIMVVGTSVAVDRQHGRHSSPLGKVLLTSCMWILEASLLYFCVPNTTQFFWLLIAPFFVYYMLEFLIRGKQVAVSKSIQRVIREANTIIYCFHPLVIHLLKKLDMSSGIALWLIATAITVACSYLWVSLKDRLENHRN